jgi:hypothetical protein
VRFLTAAATLGELLLVDLNGDAVWSRAQDSGED